MSEYEQQEFVRQILEDVLEALPGAILIGGWATWLRTGGPMSHDIDLIVDHADLAVVGDLTGDLSESRHIARRKWRATWRGVHLDLYVPYQSVLGDRLALHTESLAPYAEVYEGHRMLGIDAHIATKMEALLGRERSATGQKDRLELRRLLQLGGGGTPDVLRNASPHSPAELADLVAEAFQYLTGGNGPDRHERAQLRAMAAEWAASLRDED